MILVVGIGNTIMRDDGAGPRVIARLRARFSFPPDVELVECETSAVDLLSRLERVKRLILVDAVETGGPPGSMVRLTGTDIPEAYLAKRSRRAPGVPDLLARASLEGKIPEETVLWGIQPQSVEMGPELTPPVAMALERLTAAVAAELDWMRVDRD